MDLLGDHSYAGNASASNLNKRSSNTFCSVPQCSNYSRAGFSFHRFPLTRPVVLSQWLTALKIGKSATKGMIVCGEHFKEEDYHQGPSALKRRLKCTAIPSQKLPTRSHDRVPSKSRAQSDNSRKFRAEKRQKTHAQLSMSHIKIGCQEECSAEPSVSAEENDTQEEENKNVAAEALLELRSAMGEEECLATQVPLRCDAAKQTSLIDPCHKVTLVDMIKTDADLNAFTGINSMQLLNAISDAVETLEAAVSGPSLI